MRGALILALLLVLAGAARAETGVATSAVFPLNTQDLTPGEGVPLVPPPRWTPASGARERLHTSLTGVFCGIAPPMSVECPHPSHSPTS